ncbi:MAG: hypothetical protein CVV28_05045 [Methanobacteriales archaeon HGW-Methanobacteriales-1]|nr:MAG: hypothetical protein CVV28_05045 [Methanobacteriales archaeon HGW-Methanobacteriales-1]
MIAKKIAESSNYSVIITLISGDILVGDLHLDEKFFKKPPQEDGWLVVEKNSGGYLSVNLNPESILFNTEEGKTGDSHEIYLRNDIIADIRYLNWDNLEPVKNIPNPFAQMVCTNNFKIAKKFGLKIGGLSEFSLSVENIPQEGIKFNKDTLLFVDWEFMSKLSDGASISLSLYGLSIKLGKNSMQFALSKIKAGKIEKILSFLLEPFPFEDARISGYLVFPHEEINTEIEGEDCIIALCCKTESFDPEAPYIPIILKKKYIKYPIEYLSCIRSEIVFYGEFMEIPIIEKGISSTASLVVKGFAYLEKNDYIEI